MTLWWCNNLKWPHHDPMLTLPFPIFPYGCPVRLLWSRSWYLTHRARREARSHQTLCQQTRSQSPSRGGSRRSHGTRRLDRVPGPTGGRTKQRLGLGNNAVASYYNVLIFKVIRCYLVNMLTQKQRFKVSRPRHSLINNVDAKTETLG